MTSPLRAALASASDQLRQRPDEALTVVNGEVSVTTQDPQLYQYQARTYALLGKQGYDEKRAELAAIPEKNEKFII